jgi:hypothetical protein
MGERMHLSKTYKVLRAPFETSKVGQLLRTGHVPPEIRIEIQFVECRLGRDELAPNTSHRTDRLKACEAEGDERDRLLGKRNVGCNAQAPQIDQLWKHPCPLRKIDMSGDVVKQQCLYLVKAEV